MSRTSIAGIRIYTEQDLAVDAGAIWLAPEPSNHLLRVLRLKVGSPLILFNGQGGQYAATLIGQQSKRAQCQIDAFDTIERESPLQITLAFALLGGTRMDFIMQKAVELGVDQLQPVLTARVDAKIPADRLPSRLAHWQKVTVSASEQCGRNRLPVVAAPQKIGEWLHSLQSQVKLVCHPGGEFLSSLPMPAATSSVTILLGPEGGLTDEECALAAQFGFTQISLGPRILRAETAAISALTAVQTLWGDMTTSRM